MKTYEKFNPLIIPVLMVGLLLPDSVLILRTYTKTGSHNVIAVLPGGKRFIASSTGSLDLWDVETGEKIITYTKTGRHNAIAILPDGNRFISAGSGYINLWRTDKE